MANGDTIKTQGLCKDVPVYLQGHIFMVQLHVLPLGGCDLVLGTQWLSTMGVINWDFKHLSLLFSLMHANRCCCRELTLPQVLRSKMGSNSLKNLLAKD